MSQRTLVIAWALVLSSAFVSSPANAGFIEIGGSGSYRRSNIANDAFDESISSTGTLAYYFNEASAVEISYTDGQSKRVISETASSGHITTMYYRSTGLDFIYTIGGKDAVLRPYLKIGAQYILSKRIVDQYRYNGVWLAADTYESPPSLVPSAGLGFKFSVTQNLSMKVGVDAWTSRPMNEKPMTLDVFGRAGLSWLF